MDRDEITSGLFLVSDMSGTAFEIARLCVLGNGFADFYFPFLLRTGIYMITLFVSWEN